MRYWIAILLLQGGLLLPAHVFAQEAAATDATPATAAATGTGTLVVDVKPFSSERELPKKALRQLESGALEWGIDGTQLVFTLVNKRFIDFPVNHMTRYGTQETLSLPAGDYRVTGVGLEMTGGFNVDKILDRGAFVNEDVLAFRIEPGKTTTLSIDPVIYKDATFAVNFWMPTLNTRVLTDEGETPSIPLNTRGDASIGWAQYGGRLKFVAK